MTISPDENIKKKVGKRISQIRKDAGYSQQEVSEELGIPRSRYANYETGVSSMPDKTKDKFVKLFGISLDYLMGHSDINIFEEPAIQYGSEKSIYQLIDIISDQKLKSEILKSVFRLQESVFENQNKVIKLYEQMESLRNQLNDCNQQLKKQLTNN